MANKVFHFSNTGISSGQGFYLKEGQSSILLRNLVLDSNSPISGNNLVYNNGNQTISGVKTFASGIVAPNLVYNTGNQTISGVKTFATGVFAPNLVYNTGNQTISGIKTFSTQISVNNILPILTGTPPVLNPLYIDVYSGILGNSFFAPSFSLDWNSGVFYSNNGAAGWKFTKTPTVNGTGVLLSGSIPFVMNFGHPQIGTPTTGLTTGYFGIQLDAPSASLSNNERRRIPILQDCFLRKVVWTNFARSAIPSGTLTGYFKNFGPNPSNDDKSVGVQVTTGMSVPVINTMYNSISGNLNIPVTGGDYVSFYYVSNFSGALTVNYAVNVGAYFYV